ncbi:unnamed protein product [Chilo suppressalis]|uniref:Uncharacterized protein n=1 Tax=Chilo suppressalis TaxID=168631 RepID=A0ABN8BCI4_CHISP|nr:hypothetical protein evm_002560 [Chilo suppressalis]CAH0406501.1 unnamed protein product [Chilo suppressalis]
MALKIEGEAKLDTEPCVVAWDNKLFVGTADGFVRTFDANLSPGVSWPAHGVQLFAIAAIHGKVYTSSNDAGIRVWSAEGEKQAELTTAEEDVGVLRVFDKCLYAGDESGNVLVYEDNVEKARYNVLEEVKDLWLSPPYMFTVRDLDVTVTEIKPDESKTRFVTRHTMEGRAPLRVAGTRLVVMARGGNNMRLHDASVATSFKQLQEIKVSDMIVTSMSVCGDYVWTGGWDGTIRRYKIAIDVLEPAGEVVLGSCINGLVSTPDSAYATVSGGKVVRIKAT